MYFFLFKITFNRFYDNLRFNPGNNVHPSTPKLKKIVKSISWLDTNTIYESLNETILSKQSVKKSKSMFI